MGGGGRLKTPNKNLLINPNFKINQREKLEYFNSGNQNPGPDAWFGYNKITVEDDGIILHNFTEQVDYWKAWSQRLYNPERFSGKTITTSCLINSLDGTDLSFCPAGDFTCNNKDFWDSPDRIRKNHGTDSNGITLLSCTRKIPEILEESDICYFSISGPLDGKRIKIYMCKLEVDEESTLAYMDSSNNWRLYDIIDYDEEYRKCCNYVFNVVSRNPNMQRYFTSAIAYGANNACGIIPITNRFTNTPVIEQQAELCVAGTFLDGNYHSNVEVVASIYGYSNIGIQIELIPKDPNAFQYIEGNLYMGYFRYPQTTSKLLFRFK